MKNIQPRRGDGKPDPTVAPTGLTKGARLLLKRPVAQGQRLVPRVRHDVGDGLAVLALVVLEGGELRELGPHLHARHPGLLGATRCEVTR